MWDTEDLKGIQIILFLTYFLMTGWKQRKAVGIVNTYSTLSVFYPVTCHLYHNFFPFPYDIFHRSCTEIKYPPYTVEVNNISDL